MWICPKCNRNFKNTNQSHYCGDITSIDEYIEQAPAEFQETLQQVRAVIHKAAPDAVEKLSWKMPTFWQGKNVIQFAVHKKHLGLYPGDAAVTEFSQQLEDNGASYNKGSIQIPWDKPMPYELIEAITKYCVQTLEK